jgi:tRNA/tmRNA/rRNA uracil-C5-methylase (TrmA/RlmC/RlmD family)
LLHVSPAGQKKIKREIVRETFARIARVEPFGEDGPVFAAGPGAACRARARFRLGSSGRALGFNEAKSSRVAELAECPMLVSELNAFLANGEAVRAALPFFTADGIGVFGLGGRVFFNPREDIVYNALGKSVVFSSACFFQNNLVALEKLLSRYFTGLSGDYALDLYGGAGLFGVFLKDGFKRVTSVESNPVSASYARRNLGGDSVFGGSVEAFADANRAACPDVVVADPPRCGLSEKARRYIAKTASPKLVYVSCDAASLARDAAFLIAAGYNIGEFRLYDFYPGTARTESVCVFVR